MCIAILNKTGKLSKQALTNCSGSNRNGGGICWIEDNELKIFKSLNGNSVIDKYFKIRKYNSLPIMLHFRISTSGLINVENCHPFFVNKNLGMCHNGVLYSMPYQSEKSDTMDFNEKILQNLPENFLTNNSILSLLEKYIGFSKFVFLNNKGEFFFLNEKEGHWDTNKENWYSNYTYNYKPYYSTYNSGYADTTHNYPSIAKTLETAENSNSNEISGEVKEGFEDNTFAKFINHNDQNPCKTCQKEICDWCKFPPIETEEKTHSLEDDFPVEKIKICTIKDCANCGDYNNCAVCEYCITKDCGSCNYFNLKKDF